MNSRFGNEREPNGEFGRSSREQRSGVGRNQGDERFAWSQGRAGERSDEERYAGQSSEPNYSSDEDETYGSEWQRGNAPGIRQSGHRRGNIASPGAGSSGYGGNQGSYGANQGSYGGSSYGRNPGSYGGGSSYGRNQGRYGGYSGYGDYGESLGGGYFRNYWGRAGDDRPGEQRGGFAGRGPKGYVRSDERIREDVSDRLSIDDEVDASEIEVRVQEGEVTLEGSVPTRSMKHRAENLADDVAGVKDVHNRLRVTKGLLNELKDKLSREEPGHYANTGTKNSPGSGIG